MPQEFFRLARLCTALAGFTVLAACGGGGGSIDTGNPPGGGNPPPGNGTTVTVSGRITFDRLPFQPAANQGLNAANPVESPAREVVVEAVSGTSTLASTTTDADGNYSLTVAANTSVFIRARVRRHGQRVIAIGVEHECVHSRSRSHGKDRHGAHLDFHGA